MIVNQILSVFHKKKKEKRKEKKSNPKGKNMEELKVIEETITILQIFSWRRYLEFSYL